MIETCRLKNVFFFKQSGRTFNVGRKTSAALLHIYCVLQLSRQRSKMITENSFVTHFLSLIVVRKKFYCTRRCINSCITHFLGLRPIRDKLLMHEHNYQHIFYSCRNWRQTLTFYHVME